VKKRQANDKSDIGGAVLSVRVLSKSASAVQKGANLAVLAGRPSKQAVTAVFTKSGYALSWIARAARLGVTPEELCERFKTDPEGLKADWAKLSA
jgi:hypothetical protein